MCTGTRWNVHFPVGYLLYSGLTFRFGWLSLFYPFVISNISVDINYNPSSTPRREQDSPAITSQFGLYLSLHHEFKTSLESPKTENQRWQPFLPLPSSV